MAGQGLFLFSLFIFHRLCLKGNACIFLINLLKRDGSGWSFGRTYGSS